MRLPFQCFWPPRTSVACPCDQLDFDANSSPVTNQVIGDESWLGDKLGLFAASLTPCPRQAVKSPPSRRALPARPPGPPTTTRPEALFPSTPGSRMHRQGQGSRTLRVRRQGLDRHHQLARSSLRADLCPSSGRTPPHCLAIPTMASWVQLQAHPSSPGSRYSCTWPRSFGSLSIHWPARPQYPASQRPVELSV